MQTVSLVGYSDKLSARPGDKIDFMVSSQSDAPYEARLFRSISADPNPAGAGLVEHRCERFFPDQKFPSRRQSFHPGSHLLTVAPLVLDAQRAVTLSLMLYPTLQTPTTQTLLSFGKFALELNPQGGVTLRAGAAAISTPGAVALRQWARVQATVETSGRMTILLEDVSVLSTQTQAQTQAITPPAGPVTAVNTGPITQASQSDARFMRPVSGTIIRSYKKGVNEGIDIGAPEGAAVLAADVGTVAAITKDTKGVAIVVIKHADGLLTVYTNVDNLLVKKGDAVTRGQEIAKVRAGTPAFLHFEVRKGLESVDPDDFI